MELLAAEMGLPVIEEFEIRKIVESLKNNMAADIFKITSGHFKLVSAGFIHILTQLTNGILCSGIIPDDLKIELAMPIPQKKIQTNPDKFR